MPSLQYKTLCMIGMRGVGYASFGDRCLVEERVCEHGLHRFFTGLWASHAARTYGRGWCSLDKGVNSSSSSSIAV